MRGRRPVRPEELRRHGPRRPADRHVRHGRVRFTVTATDNAGNTDANSVSYRVAAPTRSSRSPAGRPAAPPTRSRPATATATARSSAPTGATWSSPRRPRTSSPDFIDGNGGAAGDVFRRDQQTGITEVVSAGLPRPADAGRPRGANGDAGTANTARAVSPDGRYVLFASDATDLIAGQDFPAGTQLYLRDMQAGITKLVTHNPAGLPGGDADPSGYGFSRDGKTIVFASKARSGRRRSQRRRRRLHLRDGHRRADLVRSRAPASSRPRQSRARRSARTGAASRSARRPRTCWPSRSPAPARTHTGAIWRPRRRSSSTANGTSRWRPRALSDGARISADGASVLFQTRPATSSRATPRRRAPTRPKRSSTGVTCPATPPPCS